MKPGACDVKSREHLRGTHEGAVIVHAGGSLRISGRQIGGVTILDGGELLLQGRLEGGVWVAPGGRCTIDAGAQHEGELHNQGLTSAG